MNLLRSMAFVSGTATPPLRWHVGPDTTTLASTEHVYAENESVYLLDHTTVTS